MTTTTFPRIGTEPPPPAPRETARLGLGFALLGISMLFIALTSAYIVRQGTEAAWTAIAMPDILPANTSLILAGSVAIELARRSRRAPGRWLALTLALGAAFLMGQYAAWRELSRAGMYLATNPHSSFFYLLTAVHGVHLAGGLAVLAWVRASAPPKRERRIGTAAIYWHYMGGLWIYLLILLFGWR